MAHPWNKELSNQRPVTKKPTMEQEASNYVYDTYIHMSVHNKLATRTTPTHTRLMLNMVYSTIQHMPN